MTPMALSAAKRTTTLILDAETDRLLDKAAASFSDTGSEQAWVIHLPETTVNGHQLPASDAVVNGTNTSPIPRPSSSIGPKMPVQ